MSTSNTKYSHVDDIEFMFPDISEKGKLQRLDVTVLQVLEKNGYPHSKPETFINEYTKHIETSISKSLMHAFSHYASRADIRKILESTVGKRLVLEIEGLDKNLSGIITKVFENYRDEAHMSSASKKQVDRNTLYSAYLAYNVLKDMLVSGVDDCRQYVGLSPFEILSLYGHNRAIRNNVDRDTVVMMYEKSILDPNVRIVLQYPTSCAGIARKNYIKTYAARVLMINKHAVFSAVLRDVAGEEISADMISKLINTRPDLVERVFILASRGVISAKALRTVPTKDEIENIVSYDHASSQHGVKKEGSGAGRETYIIERGSPLDPFSFHGSMLYIDNMTFPTLFHYCVYKLVPPNHKNFGNVMLVNRYADKNVYTNYKHADLGLIHSIMRYDMMVALHTCIVSNENNMYTTKILDVVDDIIAIYSKEDDIVHQHICTDLDTYRQTVLGMKNILTPESKRVPMAVSYAMRQYRAVETYVNDITSMYNGGENKKLRDAVFGIVSRTRVSGEEYLMYIYDLMADALSGYVGLTDEDVAIYFTTVYVGSNYVKKDLVDLVVKRRDVGRDVAANLVCIIQALAKLAERTASELDIENSEDEYMDIVEHAMKYFHIDTNVRGRAATGNTVAKIIFDGRLSDYDCEFVTYCAERAAANDRVVSRIISYLA